MDTRLYPVLEDRLNWTAQRHQTLSNNITNFNTPGYHSKDLSFSDELQFVQLRMPNGKHISSVPSDPRMQVYEVQSNVNERDNSVDLDREVTELARNTLQYITTVQFVSQKLKTLRSAINEGNRG